MLPREQVSIPPWEFSKIVRVKSQRLRLCGRSDLCSRLEEEFKELKCAAREPTTAKILGQLSELAIFEEGWDSQLGRYLGNVFPSCDGSALGL